MQATSSSTAEPEAGDLQDYLRPLVRSKWLIAAVVAVITAATYVYYHRQAPKYEASTNVLVQATDAEQLLDASPAQGSDRNLQNQSRLLTSRDVAEQVARRLNGRLSVDQLMASVSATPSIGSDFLVISATTRTAADAAAIANAFAKTFVTIRAKQRRTSLTTALGAARAQLRGLPRNGLAGDTARQQVQDTIRQLELGLAVPSGNASQVDPASPPSTPLSPRPVRNALFAFAFSLLLAVGLAFARERFDRHLKRVDDIPGVYGLPVLGALPRLDNVTHTINDLVAINPEFCEPFRALRTTLQFTHPAKPLKTLLVTSGLPGEGKSTVVANLAMAYQETGLAVAIVEVDMHRPTMAKRFNADRAPGMAEVLTQKASLENSIQKVYVHIEGLETLAMISAPAFVPAAGGAPQDVGVLSLLTAGGGISNPQSVLGTKKAHAVISEMASRFDVLIIDSPPMLSVADAVPLLSAADGILVVSRMGSATTDTSRRLIALLTSVPNTNVVGIVANGVTSVDGYGYGYGYRYGYSAEKS